MNETPRRFWQIHLSTAVVLMVLAGILLWLNMRPPRFIILEDKSGSFTRSVAILDYGWPLTRMGRFWRFDDKEPEQEIQAYVRHWTRNLAEGSDVFSKVDGFEWRLAFYPGSTLRWPDTGPYTPLVFEISNILSCLLILIMTAVPLEYFARRRVKP
ncbi:MAG TPA: hypothetical protein VEJ63_18185 [Planctomycetota bacterium]|nr:hypothetical protein [Planctomycetota bacterium]